jgi:adenylate cyclase
VFKVELKPGEKIPEPQSGPELSASRLSRTTLFAVAGVLIALALGLIFIFKDDLPFEKPTSADSGEIPVIAVLPFENMSDASQDYFSDGISEDIITDLSQLSGLAVIARNSSFRFRNPTETVEDISNKLGAKYLVQGSVRRDGKQIRISAQLVDGSSGHELWANRYDRELTGMFELQDEITAKIVSELSIEISGDERRQLDYTATRNFEAYDLFLQAQIIGVSFTKDTITEAINLYRQAIELDPEFARAYGAMAIQMTRQVYSGFADNPAQTRAQALDLALKGASLNPESPQVQWALGYVYLYRDEFDNSIAALERAVTLSPSYADGYAMLALIRNNLGQSEEAIRLIRKGMELNPFYSWDYLYNLGRAHYGLGNYQQAADYLEQALQRNATPRGTRLFLVATYVELGRQDDAEWEIVQLETTYPETTLSQLRQMLIIRDDELLQRLLGDLRTAGMLE